MDAPTNQGLSLFCDRNNHGFREILDPEVFQRFVAMADYSYSSVGTENFPVGSSDLSAESVADADDALSRECSEDSNDSQSVIADDEEDLRRSASEGSVITSEPSLKLRSKKSANCTWWHEQDRSTSTTVDTSSTGWTDDKHRSYLNFIEATFVKNMYDRKYCALDLCGKTPQQADSTEYDCCESRSTASAIELRTSQLGGWHPAAFTRPLISQFSDSAPPAILSPWINHACATFHPKTRGDRISCTEKSPSRADVFKSHNKSSFSHDHWSQEMVYTSGHSSESSKPENLLSSTCNHGILNRCISKEGLVRMGVQMHEKSIHPKCTHLLREHGQSRNEDLCLNTDLQLCSGNWKVPGKAEEKISKKMYYMMNKKSFFEKGMLQKFKCSRQDHLQPRNIDSTLITGPHLTSRKRKVQGGLLEKIANASNKHNCSTVLHEQVVPHFNNCHVQKGAGSLRYSNLNNHALQIPSGGSHVNNYFGEHYDHKKLLSREQKMEEAMRYKGA